jgi:hypothetical protein
VDFGHIAEVVLGNIFVAGVAYGTIKSNVSNLGKRMDKADDDRQSLSDRIDRIFELLTKR